MGSKMTQIQTMISQAAR